MTDHNLIGARAHPHRVELRDESAAVASAIGLTRDWLTAHQRGEPIDLHDLDTLLGCAQGAANALQHRGCVIVGEDDSDLEGGQ